MPESFDVELNRLVRSLDMSAQLPDAAHAACVQLLMELARTEAQARGSEAPPLQLPYELLAPALRAVAFDAVAAGVDLESFRDQVVSVRKQVTAPSGS